MHFAHTFKTIMIMQDEYEHKNWSSKFTQQKNIASQKLDFNCLFLNKKMFNESLEIAHWN